MPCNAPAGPQQPCAGVPASEVSRRTERCASRHNKVLEHGLLQLGFCEKLFEPRFLLFQLSQPSGLLGLHAATLLSPAVVGRLRDLDDATDVGDGLPLGNQLLRRLSLQLICSAVCLLRFMVESTAQSGRMWTLIHPGPVFGVHVICAAVSHLRLGRCRGRRGTDDAAQPACGGPALGGRR